MANNEKQRSTGPEQTPDIEQFGELAHERREMMRVQLERNERRQERLENQQDTIAQEAAALAHESDRKLSKSDAQEKHEKGRRGAPSKKQRDRAYKQKLESVQAELNSTERVVSKVIHVKPIEKASDFISSTIARPNAMLSGSIAAFIGVTAVYFFAKHYGFQLSGFETITAFIIGWVIGVIYDCVFVSQRNRGR